MRSMIAESAEHISDGIYLVTIDDLEPDTVYVTARFDNGTVVLDCFSVKENAIKKIKQQLYF